MYQSERSKSRRYFKQNWATQRFNATQSFRIKRGRSYGKVFERTVHFHPFEPSILSLIHFRRF